MHEIRPRALGLALLMLASCKGAPLPATLPVGLGDQPSMPTVTEAPLPPPQLGAFVLVSWDRTFVLPLDPERELVELPGQWVGARPFTEAAAWGHPEVLVTAVAKGADTIPVCAAGELGDACELPVDLDASNRWDALRSASTTLSLRVELRPDRRPRWTLVDRWAGYECSCLVVPGLSTDGEPEPELDLSDPEVLEEIAMSPYEPDEYLEHCSLDALRPKLEPTSYLGGVLYENGMSHNGVCNGLNLYDGANAQVALRPDARVPDESFPEAACSARGIGIHGPDLDEQGAQSEEDMGCHETDELLSYVIDRGRLVKGTGGVGVVGEGCGCTGTLPLSKVACPSALDPCGSGEGFEDLDDAARWWVSSDEQWALVMDDDGLAVLERGQADPRRREPALDGDEILGVELHPRSALLEAPAVPDLLRPDLPPRHEDDRDFRGNATAWGNRGFVHLKAGRLDAAEAACFAGLMAGGDERTRGALTYTLGRVAEARGNDARALTYYRRSDRLRPGNDTVAARIRALGG